MRLTEQSVFLETSRLMGAGARVRLKFDPDVSANGKNTLYPIFPGAIIALKGNNETGEHFQVSEILSVRNMRTFKINISFNVIAATSLSKHGFEPTIEANFNGCSVRSILLRLGSELHPVLNVSESDSFCASVLVIIGV